MAVTQHDHRWVRAVDSEGPFLRCAEKGCPEERDFPSLDGGLYQYFKERLR